MCFSLTDNSTIYAVEPVYKDKVHKYDMSDGKNVKISVKDNNEFAAALKEYYSDDSNDLLMVMYLRVIIERKWSTGEFGDISDLSDAEKMKKKSESSYYVIPCDYSSSDKLTKGDKCLIETVFGKSKVVPHISLEEEEGAVLKISMITGKNNKGASYTEMTLSPLDSDKKVENVLIMDIGKYPIYGGDMYFGGKGDENVVLTSSKVYITYGSDKPEPTPSPTTPVSTVSPTPMITLAPTASPTPTVTLTPTASPTPTQTSGEDDDITKDIPFAENVPVEEKTAVIKKTDTDKKDVVGSTQQHLYLRSAKVKNNSVKISWKKVKGADGYIIYGNKCGKKMKHITTIDKPSATSYIAKKLKKGTYYKYLVVAYKTTSSGDKVITTSKSVHAATTGGKVGNPTSIKVKKSKFVLKKGKKAKIKASFKKKKNVKLHIADFRYESLDKSVATVNKKGEIKAVSKGKTKILVYTQNGLSKAVSVTVK